LNHFNYESQESIWTIVLSIYRYAEIVCNFILHIVGIPTIINIDAEIYGKLIQIKQD